MPMMLLKVDWLLDVGMAGAVNLGCLIFRRGNKSRSRSELDWDFDRPVLVRQTHFGIGGDYTRASAER